jgi:hypothetical protein
MELKIENSGKVCSVFEFFKTRNRLLIASSDKICKLEKESNSNVLSLDIDSN